MGEESGGGIETGRAKRQGGKPTHRGGSAASRERPRVGRWIARGAAIVVGVAVASAIGAVMVNRQAGQSVGQSVTTTVNRLLQGGRTENILLIGNNARHANTPLAPGQADLLYVLHFEPARHTIVVISIPRDTMVAYPGWNDPIPKIKSALLMGGPKMEMQWVGKLTGMPIDGYIEADFAGFAAAINAVGGIWLDIPARLYDPTYSGANFAPGEQHLDGSQALAYVRIRQNQAGNGYRVNAFQRQDAGVQVMAALKNQVLRHESLGSLTHLLGVLHADFATDLSTAHLVGLLAAADHARLRSIGIGHVRDTMVITSTAIAGVNATGQITGAYYDILDPAEIAATLASYGAHHPWTGLAPLPPPRTIQIEVSDNPLGLLDARALRAAGCRVTLGAPASSGQVVIQYPAGDLPSAEVVGRIVGDSNEIVTPGVGTSLLLETP